jgi:hypothetical protein
MPALDVVAADAALKQMYPARRVKFVGYEGNPLLALMPKDENFQGRNMPLVIWYGGNQGASRNFQVAQANKTPGLYEDFLLTRVKDYALSSIELEAILASESDEGAFLRLARSEIDNTVRTCARNLAISMYRDHGGARGKVAVGGISGTTLTLANPTDVTNFEKNQKLIQSATDGLTGAPGAAAAVTITGVDRRAGKLTAAAWTGFSAGDYLFRQGDFGVAMYGLAEWIPEVTPTAGNPFLGVDRASDTRLYGQFQDGTGQTMIEALEDADAKIHVEGGVTTHAMINPIDLNSIRKLLGSDVIYDKVKSPDMASFSFTSIKMMGMGGAFDLIADRNVPIGRAWLLDMKTWVAASLGGQPRVLEGLGNKFIWDSNADSIEIRVGYYGNVGCFAPSYNCQVKFY